MVEETCLKKSIKARIDKVQYRNDKEKRRCVKKLVKQIYKEWNREINNFSGSPYIFYVPRQWSEHWFCEAVVNEAIAIVKKDHPDLVMYDLTADWIMLDYSKCLDDVI